MITDKFLEFSLAQAVTTDAASTNHVDLVKAGDALDGSEVYVIVRVGTAFASSGGNATLTVSVQTDDNDSFSSPKTLISTGLLAQSALTANTVILKAKLPPGAERYLRVYYDNGTEAFTGGTVDAVMALNADLLVTA